MKKISIIMMALALVMGMSQCKKNEQTASSNNGEEPIFKVTLTTNNNSKLYFGDEFGDGLIPVFFNPGVTQDPQDKIYVAVGGKCIGYLVIQATSLENYGGEGNQHVTDMYGYEGTFNADALQNGDMMELFLLGGSEQTVTVGDVDYVTFSYADQQAQPAVIAHGFITEPYDGPRAGNFEHYMCERLENMNALVKFNVVGANTDVPITICGVKNQSVVSFDGGIVNSDEVGNIVTFRGLDGQNGDNNTRYAVVPSNQHAVSGEIIADGFTGTYEIPGAGGVNSIRKGTITLTAK